MLIAIEHQDSPICETVRRSRPDSGIVYLPAVSVRFLLEPRELRLQYEAGSLRRILSPCPCGTPKCGDVIRKYRETAALFAPKPEKPEGGAFNGLA